MTLNPGDQMLAELFTMLDLDVDGETIAADVRERGFEGAWFVAVALATAGFVDAGEVNIQRAIDRAIQALNDRAEALLKALANG